MAEHINSFMCENAIVAYCEDNSTRVDPAAASVRSATKGHEKSHMMLPINIGNLISILVRASNSRQCLEIGAFTGQISTIIANAIGEGGQLASLEENFETYQLLQRNIRDCGLESIISAIHDDGFEWLRKSNIKFDFIMLDARKETYINNYDSLIEHLSSKGLLVIDNVLCRGKIVNPCREYEIAMHEFNLRIGRDPRMSVTMLPIRDGITIAQKNL